MYATVHYLPSTQKLGPVFGFTQAISKSAGAARLLLQAKQEIQSMQPDKVILIGMHGFHTHIGRLCRRRGICTVYLGAPQFWAWGKNRLRGLNQAASLVICFLPFEESLLRRAGINARYLGNPLLDIVSTTESREQTLARLGLRQTDHYIVFMPGSRRAELAFHIPLFEKVYNCLCKIGKRKLGCVPPRGVMMLPPPALTNQPVSTKLTASGNDIIWTWERRYDTMTHADCAVICSGTATLEAAILGLPMVITYHLHPLDNLMARFLIQTRYFALPNILAGRQIVPEFLNPSPQAIIDHIIDLLKPNSGTDRTAGKMKQALAEIKNILRPYGALHSIAELLTQPSTHFGIDR